MLKKKKSLEEDIKDISKQLKTVNSSDNYKKMMAFKELMDEWMSKTLIDLSIVSLSWKS